MAAVTASISDNTIPEHDTCTPRILVVDDNEPNRGLLCRLLHREGYSADTAKNGAEALAKMATTDYGVVLLDIMMPEMNGYDVLRHMQTNPGLQHLPVIVISAIDDIDSIVRCIEEGAADYLAKPFNPVLLKARIHACLKNKRVHDLEQAQKSTLQDFNSRLNQQVREQVEQITSAHLAAIFAMSKLAESKDQETGEHLERMREYCRVLSEELAKLANYHDIIDSTFIQNIYNASPLHDIGKVGIPDKIMLKPGKLDADEFEIMKTHAILGAETLRAVDREHPGNDIIRTGINIACCHHEKWDGSGYPLGLSGLNIPLSARILALADVYDALTSKRCYKEAYTIEEADKIILDSRGTHFDPDIVDAYQNCHSEFLRIRNQFRDKDAA